MIIISLMISQVKHLAKLMFSLLSHGVETGDDSKSAAFSLYIVGMACASSVACSRFSFEPWPRGLLAC